MGQIEVMSPALANQIAAGEVVERPASCVKELIENSLDAGATQIRVSLVDGGIQSITVQDNGTGMDADDARLAFSRHATSKLKHARDLTRILTLGFRGEALASIAAVAKVNLQTRRKDVDAGVSVTVEGSEEIGDPRPVGLPQGTLISVKELFFNTPARLKYLRSVQTEQARSVEAVQRAALARPDVAFECAVNDRVVFQTPGKGRLVDVLAALYGVQEARQFIEVSGQSPDYRINGLIGRPTQAKSTRAHAHLFINGRPIRNLAVHQAVIAGYHGRLMIGKHPVYSLHLEMDPNLVDVNIHPHKSEVRFSEERDLCLLVQHSVREALDAVFLANQLPLNQRDRTVANDESAAASIQSQLPVRVAPQHSSRFASVHYPQGTGRQPSAEVIHETYAPVQSRQPNDLSAGGNVQAPLQPVRNADQPPQVETADTPSQQSAKDRLRGLRLVGQVMSTYIIAEDGQNLYIIDQHAAHERILYERFWKRMRDREVRMIPLLTALPVSLSPSEHELLLQHLDELAETGLTVEDFGGTEVVIRTIPDVWEGLDAPALAEEVIRSIGDLSRETHLGEALREQVIMRACKTAIKANHRLSDMELAALCEALCDLEDPFHCPHGRPVFIQLSEHDLEKGFRRIV